MTSKYEQAILDISKTQGSINEKLVGLSNRLYDKQGDIPAILKHLDKINGINSEQQEEIDSSKSDIKELKSWSIKGLLSKKWFWVLVVVLILSILGLSGSINVQELLLRILQ